MDRMLIFEKAYEVTDYIKKLDVYQNVIKSLPVKKRKACNWSWTQNNILSVVEYIKVI